MNRSIVTKFDFIPDNVKIIDVISTIYYVNNNETSLDVRTISSHDYTICTNLMNDNPILENEQVT